MTPDDPVFEADIGGGFFGGFEDVVLGAPQTLLPLERFDCKALRRTPDGMDEFNAHRAVRIRVQKNVHLARTSGHGGDDSHRYARAPGATSVPTRDPSSTPSRRRRRRRWGPRGRGRDRAPRAQGGRCMTAAI